ncbi:hypothetical protein BGZ49_001212 [Haplosporangium sp. Z 27]|nr:hypothetical protein BGZ49_001212 [Haplosporangium sp. Z 27]
MAEAKIMEDIIIVGGGLAGLLLAVLLERASLNYIVLERSPVAKMPLEGGGIISITSQIQPLLQQLGLLDALRGMSKPVSRVTVLENEQGSGHQLKVVGTIDSTFSYSRYGYYTLAISRPELYNHLVDQIPPEKFLLGKQVKDIQQDESVATCICTDDSKYQGIIIGADGAYSNFWCMPATGNRVYWMLDELLPETQECPDIEDWSGVEKAAQEMSGEYRAMPSPLDGILLGEFFDSTPRGTIAALPREESLFSTWTHGKIALMGDACHKMLPHGGQPFVQAGYDAAKLANILYAYSLNPSGIDISARLRIYEIERRSQVQSAADGTYWFVRMLNRQGWLGTIIRHMAMNFVPQFLMRIAGDQLNADRPQAEFLPKALDVDV